MNNGTVNLWTGRHDQGHCVFSFRKHEKPISSIKILPTERQFLSGSADKTIILWDLDSGLPIRQFDKHKSQITTIDPCPGSDHQFMSSSIDGNICIFDARTSEPVMHLKPADSPPWCLSACWAFDRQSILFGRRDERIGKFDIVSGKEHLDVLTCPSGSGPVSSIRPFNEGKNLIRYVYIVSI